MKGFFRFCREANLGTKYSSLGWLTSVSYITLHQRPLFLFFTAPSRLLPTQYALFYYFIFGHWLSRLLGLPGWLSLKESTGSAGDAGMIPGSGRSSGGGNGTPAQYSCLENPMDRGAWRAPIQHVAKRQTQLNDWVCMRALKTLGADTPGKVVTGKGEWT